MLGQIALTPNYRPWKKKVLFSEKNVIFVDLGKFMEDYFIPSILHSKLYLIGFLLSLLVALPLAYARINKYVKVCENKQINSNLMPLLIVTMLAFGTVITPHFHTINELILILPIVWLMVFQANVEYHFFSFSRGAFIGIAALSLVYAYVNGVEHYDIYVALFVSILLTLIYKISPRRKNYVMKIANPYALFSVIVSLGRENMGTYLFYFVKIFVGYYFFRVLYFFVKSRTTHFSLNQIMVKFLELTKFHYAAWFVTMLTINPHIYQVI